MMKTRTKVLTLALCAVLLVTGSVMGTLAYLTSQTQTVTNTFTVGDVDILLDEAVVNEYGVGVDAWGNVPVNGATTVVRTEYGNSYKLVPGYTYTKDPVVTILEDSEPSYVRVLVTVSNSAEMRTVFGGDSSTNGIEFADNIGTLGDNWIYVDKTKSADGSTMTLEYRYTVAVGAVDTDDVRLPAAFTTFSVPGEADNDEIAALGDLTIDIVAEAIQAHGFEGTNSGNGGAYKNTLADIDDAWAAFDSQNG